MVYSIVGYLIQKVIPRSSLISQEHIIIFVQLHPWMEGIIHVQDSSANIPSYAVDESQKKINDFPLYNFTDDSKVEIGLSWTPTSIITNESIHFIMDFFEYPANTRMHLWPYDFVILQNNNELFRTSGISQVGSYSQTYAFSSTGPTSHILGQHPVLLRYFLTEHNRFSSVS